jgi:hypothetical protein
MGIESAVLSSLLLIGVSAVAAEVRHGIVKLDGAGHALLVVAEPLAAGQVVYFQYPNARQHALCCKQLVDSDFSVTEGSELSATNEKTGESPVIYKARIPRLWAEIPFVGGAVIGRRLQVKDTKGQLVVTTRQGHAIRSEMCTSQEGVHVIGKTDSVETTHLYLGLGYDIEHPSCK